MKVELNKKTMPKLQIKITPDNEEKLRAISNILNASATAAANYVLSAGLEKLRQALNEIPVEIKAALGEALKHTTISRGKNGTEI